MRDKLDLIVKVSALASLLLYVGGFVAVSIRDANYGFVAFNLLRGRVISAGVLLAILVLIPVLETSRVFGLFGLKSLAVASSEGEHQGFWNRVFSDTSASTNRLAQYFFHSWIIVFFALRLLFTPHLPWLVDLFYVGYAVAFAALKSAADVAIDMYCSGRPVLHASVNLALMLLGLAGLAAFKQWTLLFLLIWFLLLAFQTTGIAIAFRDSHQFANLSLYLVVGGLIGVIGGFAWFLYPNIPAELGGGQLIEIHFSILNESPLTKALNSQGWLVDEVDSGFYVVKSEDDHEAIFIPRQFVTAIQFKGANVL